MGLTTDMYNDMDRENLRLAAIDRQNALAEARANLAPPATEGRSFGFQSGANKPGGVAEKDYNLAAMHGANLGEPTSFQGGGGAPTPIGVIRGTRQTFATDTGGPQLTEFGTPTQARQASNQFRLNETQAETAGLPISQQGKDMLNEAAKEQFGEWRPAGQGGQTMAEVTAAANAKNPLWEAQTAATAQQMADKQRQTHLDAFGNFLMDQLGTYDKGAGAFALPKDERIASLNRRGQSMIQQGKSFDEVRAAIEPEIHRYFYTPENIQGALNLYQQESGKALTPQQQANLSSGTPQAMASLYPFIKRYKEQPKPGFFAGLFPQNRPTNTPGAGFTDIVGP